MSISSIYISGSKDVAHIDKSIDEIGAISMLGHQAISSMVVSLAVISPLDLSLYTN